MDLRRYIATIRTWLPLLVASSVLAAAAAFVISSLLPRSYEARATLIVGQSLSSANPDYSQLMVSQRLSATYAAIVTTRPMLETAIDSLRLEVNPDELASRIRADAQLDSTLLTVTAQDRDPEVAAAIANTLADQLVAASPAIQGREVKFQAFIESELNDTQVQIETTQARLEALAAVPERTADQAAEVQVLESRLTSLRATFATLFTFASGTSASLLTVIEPAAAPIDPVSPRVMLNTLLAAVLGLLVALGIAFLAEYLDESMKDSDTILEVTGLGTLGTIARMDADRGRHEIYRLAPLLYPRSGATEAYRTLRANVEFTSVDAPLRTLLVTSAMPGEGKTITASNLAIVFAQAGRRVILVDADLRKPGIHVAFKLDNSRGLTTLLRGGDATLGSLLQQTEQMDLRVLTTGPLPPNPAELMRSQRMESVLDALRQDSDLVIFDSPPLQAVTDSAILSSFLDGTLLVVDASRGRRRAVRSAREALERAGAKVLGAVLNRTPARGREGYGYYGGYFEPAKTAEPPGSAELPQPGETLPGPSGP